MIWFSQDTLHSYFYHHQTLLNPKVLACDQQKHQHYSELLNIYFILTIIFNK